MVGPLVQHSASTSFDAGDVTYDAAKSAVKRLVKERSV